jgi:Mg2+-importing ATPase
MPAGVSVLPSVLEAAGADAEGVLRDLQTSTAGLTEEEAERRLDEYGPNIVGQQRRYDLVRLLGRAVINPLVIVLVLLGTASFLTRDVRAGTVISLMVALGVALRFVQEARASSAAAKLAAMISVTATVVRDDLTREVRLEHLVPGDVVRLSAGDMIPADVRLISCRDLFLTQSALTGESLPVEKDCVRQDAKDRPPLELSNVCFLGTSVQSGTATAVVLTTGSKTYLGRMANAIVGQPPPSSFDKGISRMTWLMIRLMLVMIPLVFVINGLTKHNWEEAFFFAMAVAVGLTPEMLPMIVTVCLSKGAMAMSRKKVIVKRLSSIQNLGAMDVLCTDKTGTLTLDRIILEKHFNVFRQENDAVLTLAYLNSHFQTGLKNVLDRAILDHKELHAELSIQAYQKIDEIPFDFSRKLMSVVVETPHGTLQLITKGAPEEVFKRCTRFELEGKIHPMQPILLVDLEEEHRELGKDGFRVLAIASKDLERKAAYSKDDEKDLVLRGYVAFLDPPKETAAAALAALQERGVSVKILTGDNELVTGKICHEVGLSTEQVLLGAQVEQMSDAELAEVSEKTTIFARLSPAHKQRIVKTLQSRKHVVGFLGDGVNDAPALHSADVGISVDTAADLAKESADAILLEKNLMVLSEGVLEGRKVFANIIKYIRMGASSNFGNMFSVVGASAFLPFVPMAPIQILTNNLLYDFSQVPIPTDAVDPEQIAKPRPWSMGEIFRFMLFIGPISSIFDYTTYFIMLYVFKCWNPTRAPLFHTGWLVESLLTQTLIIHIIRTNRIPFIQSRASWPVIMTTACIMVIGMWLPSSPLGPPLGLTPLPLLYWPLLAVTLTCYVLLTQGVKALLLRKAWI